MTDSKPASDVLKSIFRRVVLVASDLACFWFMLLPFVLFKNIEYPVFFKSLALYGVYLFGMSAFRGAFCSGR